jgi:lipid II:glycine glycyltransferase (peptidoglycan interpeptide bridge formation enzyme)
VSWAREEGLARLRVEPEAGPEVREVLARLGFRRARQVQPAHTLVVPLGDEAAMLGSLRRTTRYNVRLAGRRGVHVEEGEDASELARQVAWSATHHRFRAPGRGYFRLLLDELPWCRTYVARHRGRALAAMLVARHDGRAYYLFAGSCRERPDLKPVDALIWAALRAAHRDGCRDFDLWGMPPGDDPAHPWYGFGQFKEGFGGRRVEYAGTWDLVLSQRDHRVLVAEELLRRAARKVLPRFTPPSRH